VSQAHEWEETLVLKREFAGELENEEAAAVERFLATPEGRAYLAGVHATRALVKDETRPPSPAAAAELRARFEATMRANARFLRGRMRGFFLLSFGAATGSALFFGHVLPRFRPARPGAGDVLGLWLVMGGAAALFCAIMYYRLRELERAPDLFDRLTGRERRVPRTLAAHLRKLPIVLLLVALVAREQGWVRAFFGVLVLYVLFALAAHFLRAQVKRQRLGMDAELWAWWYGEVGE